jgi:plastocyanin
MSIRKLPDHSIHLGRGLSRRALLRGAVGSAALVAISAAGFARGADERSRAGVATQLREFTLMASEFDHEMMPGTTVRAWGYNGQTPGPELRVREGDTVRVTLRNQLPVPTTIHWHGIHNTPAMDGPAGLNQAAVEPGDEFVYEFAALPGGSRWYHSHADPALQIPLGLYGPLIIEPREPAQTYDREYTLMLAEWDLELTPEVAAGLAPRGPRDRALRGGELGTDLFLINGRMHGAIPPLRLTKGERVLLRVMHAGHLAHPLHIHGHSFKIVATDGNPVPELTQLTKDTVLIGPAERYDLEIVGDNPGVWMVHCHIEHHMANGMMTTLWYDGHQPTGPAAAFFATEGDVPADGSSVGHAGHGAVVATVEPTSPAPTATAAGSGVEAGVVEIALVDDRIQPREIEVPAGTTVTWINKGRDWHSVASNDAGFESGKIEPGGRYAFRFETTGVYRYFCRHHALAGMTGQVTVT